MAPDPDGCLLGESYLSPVPFEQFGDIKVKVLHVSEFSF